MIEAFYHFFAVSVNGDYRVTAIKKLGTCHPPYFIIFVHGLFCF